MIERRFTELSDEYGPQGEPRPLRAFWDRACLVVLGEPGAGKTTVFKEAAAAEGAERTTVRGFLRKNVEPLRGRTLYLDALDEARIAERRIDDLAERLNGLAPARFRLSCRAADWRARGDKEALEDASADGKITLLRLEPLNGDDVTALIEGRGLEPNKFLDRAKRQGLTLLLENPQNLSMLVEVVRKGGGWPDTRRDLFDRAIKLMLEEHNRIHGEASDPVPADELRRAAGWLCALSLIADEPVLALCGGAADVPSIVDLTEPAAGVTERALREVVKRRLFGAPGDNTVRLPHRTLAEYLAAETIALRIEAGLPERRALALITGVDGGTLADLRGLHAWLVALSPPDSAGRLVVADPLGAVVYGDATAWPVAVKRAALLGLEKLKETNPYFRAGVWGGEPFGPLGVPELEGELRRMLETYTDDHLLGTVLDVVQHGAPLPGLGDALLEVARNDEVHGTTTARAARAFVRACPDRVDDLETLLREVHIGKVSDDTFLLRTTLLELLYPSHLKPDQLAEYLVEEPDGVFGDYWHLALWHLPRVVPTGHLAPLAEGLVEHLAAGDGRRNQREELLGKIIVRSLEEAPPTAGQIARWLTGSSGWGWYGFDESDQKVLLELG